MSEPDRSAVPDPGPCPDLSRYGTLREGHYEWFLSDHPWAVAERRRRRAAYYERKRDQAVQARAWVGATDTSLEGAALAEILGPMADEAALRAQVDEAEPDELWVDRLRREHELVVRISEPDYHYPGHLIGPGAAAYPPPGYEPERQYGAMSSSKKAPYRVVDREQQGWHRVGADREARYAADYGWRRELPNRPSYEQLERGRGPLRPIAPITEADSATLRAALRAAGRKAATTLAAALADLYRARRDAYAGDEHDAGPAAHEHARRALVAGREGSWESEALIALMVFGSGLKASRVHAGSRQVIAELLTRWATDPERYTELTETLAGEFSAVADEAGGWAAVADQWLQSRSLAADDAAAAYRYLMSASAHFDPDVGQR